MDLAASHSASALSLNVSSHASFIPPIMHVLSTAVLLGSVAVQKVLGRPGSSGTSDITKRAVTDFINTETPIALNNLICNVGPDGCRAYGTSIGAVVASPSTTDPDCKLPLPLYNIVYTNYMYDALTRIYSKTSTCGLETVPSSSRLLLTGSPRTTTLACSAVSSSTSLLRSLFRASQTHLVPSQTALALANPSSS